MARSRIALAASFERNLEAMRLFLEQSGAPPGVYDEVVNTIVGRLFPLLEDHPRAGRDWLRNPPPTESGQLLQRHLLAKLEGRRELRELVLDRLLMLYAIEGNTVTLLALRHHRQLGFELG
jgi:hypothetical protein